MANVAKRRDHHVLDYYADGKRRWKMLPKGTRKADAEKELRRILEDIDSGKYISAREDPSFSSVADGGLLNKKVNIRGNTYTQYRSHVEKHLKPFLGNKKSQIDKPLSSREIHSRCNCQWCASRNTK